MYSGNTAAAAAEEIIPMLPVSHNGESGRKDTPSPGPARKLSSSSASQQKATSVQPRLVEIKQTAAATANSGSGEPAAGNVAQTSHPVSVREISREPLKLGQYLSR